MEQPKLSPSEGWLLAPLWKNRLTLPPFPSFFIFFLLPHHRTHPPPLHPSNLSSPLHPFYLSRVVCFCCLCLTKRWLFVMISNPTNWLLHTKKKERKKKVEGEKRDQTDTEADRALSQRYHDWQKQTASIHLNAGYFSYCWCPYPLGARHSSGGMHSAGLWFHLFCPWVDYCFTWDIKHGWWGVI